MRIELPASVVLRGSDGGEAGSATSSPTCRRCRCSTPMACSNSRSAPGSRASGAHGGNFRGRIRISVDYLIAAARAGDPAGLRLSSRAWASGARFHRAARSRTSSTSGGRPNPYRWRVLGVSVAATFALMVVMIPESERIEPRPPEVTWITTFQPDRTDAEIIASNIENQKRKDKLAAEARRARAAAQAPDARALGQRDAASTSTSSEAVRRRSAAAPSRRAGPGTDAGDG